MSEPDHISVPITRGPQYDWRSPWRLTRMKLCKRCAGSGFLFRPQLKKLLTFRRCTSCVGGLRMTSGTTRTRANAQGVNR